MIGDYNKTIYKPGEAPAINAANLNKNEDKTKELDTGLSSHLNDNAAHNGIVSLYRSGKDANGVYATLEWKRPDGKLWRKSVLSGGTSPKYTTRTVTYYGVNGTTVNETKVYTLSYTGDDLTSEVLQ